MGRPRCQDHEFARDSVVCVSCSSAVPLTPGFGYTKHCGHASPEGEGGPPTKRCGPGEFTGGLGLCEPCSRCGGPERVAEPCSPARNTRCCPEGQEVHDGSCRGRCCDCSLIRGAEGGAGRDPECVKRERSPIHCRYSKAATCRGVPDTARLPVTPRVLTLGGITRRIEVPPPLPPPSPPSSGLQGAAAAGGSEAMLLFFASLALSSMLFMLLVLLVTRGPRCWRGRPPKGARGAQDTRGQGSLELQGGDLKPQQGEASAGDQSPMLDTHTPPLREVPPLQQTREQELTERIHASPWFSLPLERLLDALDVCDRLSQLLDPELPPLASARHLASRCGLERHEVAALAARGVSLTRAALEVTAARDPGVTVGSLLESLLRMERADALQAVLGAEPPPRHGAGLGFGADLSTAANTGSGDTGTGGTSGGGGTQCGCSGHVNGSAYSSGYGRAKGSVTSGVAHTMTGRAALPDETTRPSNGCTAHTCT
ncbi:IGF-like family receptor 1 [Lampetra planeri]